jgi:hypothetical protein
MEKGGGIRPYETLATVANLSLLKGANSYPAYLQEEMS